MHLLQDCNFVSCSRISHYYRALELDLSSRDILCWKKNDCLSQASLLVLSKSWSDSILHISESSPVQQLLLLNRLSRRYYNYGYIIAISNYIVREHQKRLKHDYILISAFYIGCKTGECS